MGDLEFPDKSEATEDGSTPGDAQAYITTALAAIGLVPDRPPVREAEPYFIWPENVFILNAFMGLMTQWYVGPAGPTGMIWSEARHYAEKISRRARRLESANSKHELLAFFKAMESGVLNGSGERAERNRSKDPKQ